MRYFTLRIFKNENFVDAKFGYQTEQTFFINILNFKMNANQSRDCKVELKIFNRAKE